MDNEKSIDLSYVCLHGQVFVPGVGQLGPTIAPNGPKDTGVKLSLTDKALTIIFKGHEVLVPISSVFYAIPVNK